MHFYHGGVACVSAWLWGESGSDMGFGCRLYYFFVWLVEGESEAG